MIKSLRLASSITRVKYHFQENFCDEKVVIFISGSGSNMVSLVNSMYRQNYACPSLVLSNKLASGLPMLRI